MSQNMSSSSNYYVLFPSFWWVIDANLLCCVQGSCLRCVSWATEILRSHIFFRFQHIWKTDDHSNYSNFWVKGEVNIFCSFIASVFDSRHPKILMRSFIFVRTITFMNSPQISDFLAGKIMSIFLCKKVTSNITPILLQKWLELFCNNVEETFFWKFMLL